jgi:hypothetical protein
MTDSTKPKEKVHHEVTRHTVFTWGARLVSLFAVYLLFTDRQVLAYCVGAVGIIALAIVETITRRDR